MFQARLSREQMPRKKIQESKRLRRRLCLRPRSLQQKKDPDSARGSPREVLARAQRQWLRLRCLRSMRHSRPALRRRVLAPPSAAVPRKFPPSLNQRQKVVVSGRVRVTLGAASVRIRAQLAESPTSVTPPCGVRAMKGMRRPRSTPYREDDTRPLRALSTKRWRWEVRGGDVLARSAALRRGWPGGFLCDSRGRKFRRCGTFRRGASGCVCRCAR